MKLPEKLPTSLALKTDAGSLYTRMGVAYNYAIGGQPFLSAASREDPIIRETAPVRKEQFDQQTQPGEQSLDYWWLRSQHSFHGGAGQIFADPSQDNQFNAIRFRDSRNVNVWDQGEVKLLNGCQSWGQIVYNEPLAGFTDATEVTFTTDFFLGGLETETLDAAATLAFDVIVLFVLIHPNPLFPSAIPFPLITDIAIFPVYDENPITGLQSITSNGGDNLYLAGTDGVYFGDLSNTDTLALGEFQKLYNIPNTDPVFIAFVKSRLILAVGPSLYELAPTVETPPASLPTPIFTHPDPRWRWTGITETSSAIYCVGNSVDGRGAILKLVLDQDGEVPTLSAPTIACQLPSGEVPYSAMGYLGNFIGIGTNKGVRVGVSDTNGDITYGPLLFESDGPVRGWSARDRFLFCTVTRGNDGDSGLYRIDLSTEIAPLRFAYAPDLVAAPADAMSPPYPGTEEQIVIPHDQSECVLVAHVGRSDYKLFATANEIYAEEPYSSARTGYLQTSRIRYNTVEPKIYKFVRVRGPILGSSLGLQTIDQNDNPASNHSFAPGRSPGGNDVVVSSPRGPIDFMSLRFIFNASYREVFDDEDLQLTYWGDGAELWAYQLKALPATPRQRIIQLPVFCFDWELDRNGQRRGGKGNARRRLRRLENVERRGDTVILQDFDAGENFECVIERLSFRQISPPPGHEGWGGIITATMRTVR